MVKLKTIIKEFKTFVNKLNVHFITTHVCFEEISYIGDYNIKENVIIYRCLPRNLIEISIIRAHVKIFTREH